MFIGEYCHTVDAKKRLAVPVKFRKDLGKKAVLTRGLDNCLYLYPMKEWEKLAKKLSELPISRSDSRAFARLMLAGAMDVSLDGLGRALVPDYLKKYAGLGKRVVLAGLYNRIEIWDEEKWEAYKKQTAEKAEDIAEKMNELGI
ncbi:division/cell wall cluster transcriptional repressor MraZ [Patescibacteria group bacterium]|nr:division/cell wall cluster transcriptional repressor MraZ [Patescibacteria group bacterium]MBU2579905.1 division/cell wall cluster transcriptional repressor MraZ [Patescibacteria group bacterium]MBU4031117.1 division/cell wall cluster transcriptional repressor MraZ [Patescibacteria group bacterium]MBU4082934.1 division/cell wall cluster transcriptional repressor MraZ [Patescibacteria group bacterium]